MTVPVLVNGQGPFAFVVDCAAEASVISDRLADLLALPASGEITMHSLAGPERVTTVRAQSMVSGGLRSLNARLIRGSSVALGDVAGLLGADLLAGKRLVFRFGVRRSVAIESSRSEWIWPFSGRHRVRFETGTTRTRGGLLTLQAQVRGIDATIILDSGAATSVMNPALARDSGALLLPMSMLAEDFVVSPTGLTIGVQPYMLKGLRFGSVSVRDQVVLAADLHTFRILGFGERPAMLMGMDILSRFRLVVIDLQRGDLVLHR